MFCRSCGVENADDAAFCRGCGQTIGATASEVAVPVQASVPTVSAQASATTEELVHETKAAAMEFLNAIPTPAEDSKYYLWLGLGSTVCLFLSGRVGILSLVTILAVAYGAILAYKSANKAWVVLSIALAAVILDIPFFTAAKADMNDNFLFIMMLLLSLAAVVSIIFGFVLAFRFATKSAR